MKTRNILTVVAAAAFAVFAQGAYAQQSRAEVKEETKAANKAGQIPGGEAAGMKAERAEKAKASTTTKAERKTETRAANKSGQIEGGETAGMKAAKADAMKKSSVDRAERKAKTRAANKSGQLAPAGENPTPKQ